MIVNNNFPQCMGNQFLILIFKTCIYVFKICMYLCMCYFIYVFTDSNSIAVMYQSNNHQVKPV